MLKHPEQACINCHFLQEQLTYESVDTDSDDRIQLIKGTFRKYESDDYFFCHFLVWSEGYESQRIEHIKNLIETDRRGFCFFWPYHPGMMMPAAETLQKRAVESAETEKNRRLTRRSIWIAGIALAANVVWNILNEFVF
jgi:hypothetical protein